MRKNLALSALLVFALLAGFAASFAMPSPAEAGWACGAHSQYFSDPGMTNLIGERWVTTEACGCEPGGWGSTAGYRCTVDDPVCIIE